MAGMTTITGATMVLTITALTGDLIHIIMFTPDIMVVDIMVDPIDIIIITETIGLGQIWVQVTLMLTTATAEDGIVKQL